MLRNYIVYLIRYCILVFLSKILAVPETIAAYSFDIVCINKANVTIIYLMAYQKLPAEAKDELKRHILQPHGY